MEHPHQGDGAQSIVDANSTVNKLRHFRMLHQVAAESVTVFSGNDCMPFYR